MMEPIINGVINESLIRYNESGIPGAEAKMFAADRNLGGVIALLVYLSLVALIVAFIARSVRTQDLVQNGYSGNVGDGELELDAEVATRAAGGGGFGTTKQLFHEVAYDRGGARGGRSKDAPEEGAGALKKSRGVRFADSLIKLSITGYRSLLDSGRQLLRVATSALDNQPPGQQQQEQEEDEERRGAVVSAAASSFPHNRASISISRKSFGGFFPRRTRRRSNAAPSLWMNTEALSKAAGGGGGGGCGPTDLRSRNEESGDRGRASIDAFSTSTPGYSTPSQESRTTTDSGGGGGGVGAGVGGGGFSSVRVVYSTSDNASAEVSSTSLPPTKLVGSGQLEEVIVEVGGVGGTRCPSNTPVNTQKISSDDTVLGHIGGNEDQCRAKLATNRTSRANEDLQSHSEEIELKVGKTKSSALDQSQQHRPAPKVDASAEQVVLKLGAYAPKLDTVSHGVGARETGNSTQTRLDAFNTDRRNATTTATIDIPSVQSKLMIVSSVSSTVTPDLDL